MKNSVENIQQEANRRTEFYKAYREATFREFKESHVITRSNCKEQKQEQKIKDTDVATEVCIKENNKEAAQVSAQETRMRMA